MDNGQPRRRALLRLAAVAAAATVTGCASGTAGRDGDTDKSPSPRHPADDTGPADAASSARSPGNAWRYAHFGDAWDATYVALAASAEDNVWVLGRRGLLDDEGQTKAFLERYDGRGWRTHPLPDALRADAGAFALTATGPRDVWLAQGDIENGVRVHRWDGGKWRALPEPPTGSDAGYGAPDDGNWLAAAGPDDAWLCFGGKALHWNGSAWRDTGIGFNARSVGALPARDAGGTPVAWAVGFRDTDCQRGECYPQPATARWRDGSWQTVETPSFRFPDPVPPEASASLDAVCLAEDKKRVWALGDHTFNHGEVDEEPEDEPIVLEWDGKRWTKHRLPKLSRGLDAATTVADGVGGLLLDADTHLTKGGDVHRIAQPPDIAGRDGSTPTPRRGRRSAQNMSCTDTCLVPGTSTVLAVGAVEFDSDTAERPSRPMVARYDAGNRT